MSVKYMKKERNSEDVFVKDLLEVKLCLPKWHFKCCLVSFVG